MQDLIGSYLRLEKIYRMYVKSAFPLRYDALSNEREQLLSRIGEAGSLSHDIVRLVYEDRSGELWIGTHGGGNLAPAVGVNASLNHRLQGQSVPIIDMVTILSSQMPRHGDPL